MVPKALEPRMRVVVVGSLNLDLVAAVDRHPSPGETVLAREMQRLPGGKGANQALAVARAGAPVSLVGRVGGADEGRRYRDELGQRGVDVAAVHVLDGQSTGHALIVVDAAGENSIVVVPGANARLSPADLVVHEELLRSADVVLLQLEVPMPTVRRAASVARASGATVVLNPSPWDAAARALVAEVDLLVVNEHEAAALGEVHQPRIVTRGARGAVWYDGRGVVEAAAEAVEVVDTTGAGDVFAGWIAAGIAQGLDRRTNLARAVDAAAASVQRRGAQGWAL